MYQETERDGTSGRMNKVQRIRRDFSEEVTEKICPHCQVELPVRRFNKNRTTRDGYQYRCKMCQSEQVKACRERKKNEQ